MGWLADETGLEKCAANHVPLTPLSFLARAADIFATREAMVYGATRYSYAEYRTASRASPRPCRARRPARRRGGDDPAQRAARMPRRISASPPAAPS
jgi:hypothetical protein